MFKIPSLTETEQYLFRRGGKYPVIGIAVAIIHMLYLFFYYRIGIYWMVFYNIIIISLYLYLAAEAYKGNQIKSFFLFATFEIPLHATLSTLILGFEYQFMLIVICSVVCVFYFVLFVNDFKHPILTPTVIAVLYCILYFSVRKCCEINGTIYSNLRTSESDITFFVYFNTTISFMMIIMFSMLTSIEYGYIKGKLVSENNQLDQFATFDPLTNLLNRRSGNAKLKLVYDKHYHDEDAFSIIMCDIDKFKLVNDTYGHDAGDFVLKEVAWILKDSVRGDDVVCRWGGEEFLVIVNSSKSNAAVLAERIRSQIEAHTYRYNNLELKVTLTLGVSSYHANTDITSLIKSADQKLYRGKENGRNQVVS